MMERRRVIWGLRWRPAVGQVELATETVWTIPPMDGYHDALSGVSLLVTGAGRTGQDRGRGRRN